MSKGFGDAPPPPPVVSAAGPNTTASSVPTLFANAELRLSTDCKVVETLIWRGTALRTSQVSKATDNGDDASLHRSIVTKCEVAHYTINSWIKQSTSDLLVAVDCIELALEKQHRDVCQVIADKYKSMYYL